MISIKGCRDAQFQLEIYNRKQVYIPVKVWISLSQTIVWKINDSRQSPLQFYFFDVGVYRTLRPMGPLDAPEEVDGIALETLFLQEFIAFNSAFDFGYKIFYWRTSNGREVDFVLYSPKGLLSFEIKRTSRITSALLGGLKSFLADYPMAKAYFVYTGNRRMYEGKIEIIPVLEILNNLGTLL